MWIIDEVTEGNKGAIIKKKRVTHDISAKNQAISHPYSEDLLEAEFKGNGLISLVEWISRQHNTESAQLLLLTTRLLTTRSRVYSEKER